MNLFWKNLFGGVMSAAKMETLFAARQADYERYQFVSQSKELEEYKRLFEVVKSAAFKENKRVLISRKYSDTQEYRDTKKFQKLERNTAIARYNKTSQSELLAEFLAFKDTPEYNLLGKRAEVKKSEELQKFKRFERSSDYKNYMRFHGSYIIKEYETLKEKVATKEFVENNEFWANSHRWETTADYQTEKRFLELAANEDIIFYEKTDPKSFELTKKHTPTFSENFDWNTLNASKWESGFFYKQKELIGNYSLTSEKQANNNGSNTFVSGGFLNIAVRKEQVEARAWDAKLGFVKRPFNFTADVIHGNNAIAQQHGVWSAKIRFKGNAVSHAFWLATDSKVPQITICKYDGKAVEVGVHWRTKFENKYTSRRIGGLNFGAFHIFTLEWTPKELIWYINNVEVLRTSNGVPTEKMFPMLNSFIAANQKGGEGTMEIDWVKVFN